MDKTKAGRLLLACIICIGSIVAIVFLIQWLSA